MPFRPMLNDLTAHAVRKYKKTDRNRSVFNLCSSLQHLLNYVKNCLLAHRKIKIQVITVITILKIS